MSYLVECMEQPDIVDTPHEREPMMKDAAAASQHLSDVVDLAGLMQRTTITPIVSDSEFKKTIADPEKSLQWLGQGMAKLHIEGQTDPRRCAAYKDAGRSR